MQGSGLSGPGPAGHHPPASGTAEPERAGRGAGPRLPFVDAIVSVREVSRSFGDLAVLDRVGLEIEPGEIVALTGPSGCGKSTLLELVGGLAEPSRGRIIAGGGHTAAERITACAWMPQKDCLLPWLSALDNASLAGRNRGRSRREARTEADRLFSRLGLGGFEHSLPRELSGGMRQRVAFLRTLLAGKRVLLLDEPFAALDALTRGEVQEWLLPLLESEGRSVLLVTHDIEEALYLADRVAVMSPRPGRVVAGVPGFRGLSGSRRHVVSGQAFNQRREELLGLLQPGPAPGPGAVRT